MAKLRVGVFFGGESPEHDVSVATGVQVMDALDADEFDVTPVYVGEDGRWRVGDPLRRLDAFVPAAEDAALTEVALTRSGESCALEPRKKGFSFSRATSIPIDIALICFHGGVGENGALQGCFESMRLPYTGMRMRSAALSMDKIALKQWLAPLPVRQLPALAVRRPERGYLVETDALARGMAAHGVGFPAIVKPVNLGSSIGVARATNAEEVQATCAEIFNFDTMAMVEPCVENLVEYNISVRKSGAETAFSAIERPFSDTALLDFAQKYRSGGKSPMSAKTGGRPAAGDGMLAMTRELNPSLAPELLDRIHEMAGAAFSALEETGAPRIDFLCDSATGEIWFNEINPTPGSFAYFLWEAAPTPTLFPSLLEHLIAEGVDRARSHTPRFGGVPELARLFPRR